jgi:hypothetical protein
MLDAMLPSLICAVRAALLPMIFSLLCTTLAAKR